MSRYDYSSYMQVLIYEYEILDHTIKLELSIWCDHNGHVLNTLSNTVIRFWFGCLYDSSAE